MNIRQSPQNENNDRLRELRSQFNLTRLEIQVLTGHSGSAVDSWLVNPEASWARQAPGRMIRLLEFELGLGKANRAFKEIRERAE